MNNHFRHEEKYLCSRNQIEHLLKILSAILPTDSHQLRDSYHIRSLYFDTLQDRFLSESLDGIVKKSKYRIRKYNNENRYRLERKSSFFHLKQKQFVWLNKEEVMSFLAKDDQRKIFDNQLINEYYYLKKIEQLMPKIIVDYDRTAFVLDNLNLRITLDRNIKYSSDVKLFIDGTYVRNNVLENEAGILEIKYDNILPMYIIQALNSEDLMLTSFSKYVRSRLICK